MHLILATIIKLLFNSRGEVGFLGTTGDPEPAPEGGGGQGTPDDFSHIKYPDGFDKSLVGSPVFKNFINTDGDINYANLMKSYAHTQKMMGADKVVIPNENFSDEQWREFHHKIGLPKSLEEYTVENKLPEGLTANEEMFGKFKEAAFNAGILPDQAQKILNFYNETSAEAIKTLSTQQEESYNAEITSLKNEWGEKFEHNCKVAMDGLEAFADEETIGKLNEQGFLNNPMLTKLFSKIGYSLKEEDGQFNDTTKHDIGMTPDEINSEIRSMYDPKHPYRLPNHPDHASSQARFQELIKKKMKHEGRNPNQIVVA